MELIVSFEKQILFVTHNIMSGDPDWSTVHALSKLFCNGLYCAASGLNFYCLFCYLTDTLYLSHLNDATNYTQQHYRGYDSTSRRPLSWKPSGRTSVAAFSTDQPPL